MPCPSIDQSLKCIPAARRFFMVANAIAAGYLVLSLPFSAAIVLRPQAIGLRHLLLVCDLVAS